jgi:hypothetical protein
MSKMKGLWRWAVLMAAGMLVTTAAAHADVVANQAAAILVFPKIQVDVPDLDLNGTNNPMYPIDTIVQITNTSDSLVNAKCFYVRANSFCAGGTNDSKVCELDTDCPGGGHCVAQWGPPRDFNLTLTKRQPLEWRASQGLTGQCPPDVQDPEAPPPDGCPENRVPLSGGRVAQPVNGPAQDNGLTSVPPTESQFIGELKCIEVDSEGRPVDTLNDLKGEATIVTTTNRGLTSVGGVDVRKYNAFGIQALGSNDKDANLVLGGPDAEYNACPNVLVVNHFFDSNGGSVDTHYQNGTAQVTGGVSTHLVFVPCSEDLAPDPTNPLPEARTATLQFLIFNEFEQRFSTSTRVDCFKDVKLSDIDSRPGSSDDTSSIFSFAVQGTLTGQSRIRPVPGQTLARKVLAIEEEQWDNASAPKGVSTTARTVQSIQPIDPHDPPLPDVIRIPEPFPF